jgi:hypothetical protein
MTEQPPMTGPPQYAPPSPYPYPPAGYAPEQYPAYPYAYGAPPPPRKKSRKLPIIIGAAVAGLVLVGGGVTALVMAAGSDTADQVAAAAGMPVAAARSPFQDVQASCDPSGSGTTIADNGKTLIIDSSGEEDLSGISYDALDCIMNAVHMSAAAQAHVGETRALDGRQQDSWDGFTASWTYHPDQGCDMVIQVA